MANVRVSALAKEFKVSSDALVQVLRSIDVAVKSHNSSVDDSVRSKIKVKLDEQRAAIKEKYAKKESRLSQRRTARSARTPRRVATSEGKEVSQDSKRSESNDNRGGNRPRSGNSDNRSGYRGGNQGQGNSDNRGGYRGGNQGQGSSDNRGGYRGGNQGQGNSDNRGGYRGGNQGQGNSDNRGGYRGGNQGQGNSDNRGGYRGGNQGQGGGYRGGDNRNNASTSARPDQKTAQNIANSQAAQKGVENGAAKKKHGKKRSGKDKYKKNVVSEVEMKANIKKTLAKIGAGSTRKKYKKSKEEEVEVQDTKELNVSEFVSVSELAALVSVNATEVITKCLELGLFVTINQRLDFDTIQLLAEEFGYTAILTDEFAEDIAEEEEEDTRELFPRAPIVTIMGHVDHGKTSLLDYIRKENVTSGEAGGITQHIAAYSVTTKNGAVTFMDTPGHEAFAAMRARGSQITDVIVLIVAADSGVMPQTKEAIDHARAAEVPMVVAINKVDLPTANVDKIKSELAQYDVLVEDYGGQISCVELSAKTGAGIDDLLELLALETEILELQAPKEGIAKGVVIESELDKGKGAVATVLIQKGTLRKGEPFVTGVHSGRVRELFNDRGEKIKEAGPSEPAIVLGLTGTPQAGDPFKVVANDQEAREISAKRRLAEKERELRNLNIVTLDNFFETIKAGEIQTLNIIVKGDVDGSVEAVASSLEKLSTDEIKVNVILKGVGGVKDSDIMLAQASRAIVIGFHINPNPKIREHAREAGVDIRTYRIIYEAVDDVKAAMIGMLIPDIKEEITGSLEVREIFKVSKLGQIAGCMVTSGFIERSSKTRLIRDDIEIADTKIASLQRHKDQVKEVKEGFDCGIMLEKVNEYEIGDRIEVYKEIEIERKSLVRDNKDKGAE